MRVTTYAVYFDNCFCKIKKPSKIQFKLRNMSSNAEFKCLNAMRSYREKKEVTKNEM